MGFLLGAQVFPGGHSLMLASARASDSGVYSCVAVSAVGEDRRDVPLHVLGECQSRRPRLQSVGLGVSGQIGRKGGGCETCGLRPSCLPVGVSWSVSTPLWTGERLGGPAQPGDPSSGKR